MIIEVLTTDTTTVSIRIVSPAEDPRMGEVIREEIAEPVLAIRGSPSLVAVSVQAVHGNNAEKISSVVQQAEPTYSTTTFCPSATIDRP
jgi:hypothetical protein